MENTAKIYILGGAAVLVSGIMLEDWKKIGKYAPDALKVRDESGTVSFEIKTGESGGSVTKEKICWGSYTDGEGRATVTVLLDESVDDKQAAVTDVMGSALLELMEIEKGLPEILKEIRKKEERISGQIFTV